VSTISNIKSLWSSFKNKNAKTFTIVRDVEFINNLNSKNIQSAIEVLKEWDKFLKEVINMSDGKSITVLITSTAGRSIEFPLKGRQWSNFLSKGRSILYRNQSLTAGVWAHGPGAENFCGIYEDDKVFTRILWAPEKRFIDQFITF